MTNVPLTHEKAWLGLWVREASGPTPRGVTITYGPWHYVATVEPPLGGAVGALLGVGSTRRCRVIWPHGGRRLEVANLFMGGAPEVGAVCLLCSSKLNIARSRQVGRQWEAVPPVSVSEVDRALAQLVPGYVAQELEALLPRVVQAIVEALLEEVEP